MNFNEEIAKEFEKENLGGHLVYIKEEDKATKEDWAKLEARILLKVYENEIMMEESVRYANKTLIPSKTTFIPKIKVKNKK